MNQVSDETEDDNVNDRGDLEARPYQVYFYFLDAIASLDLGYEQDIASPSTRITPHRDSPSILFISEYQFCLVGRFQISMIHGPVP